jgi:pimeloyl-ACP methyl ester carboxylesterase
LIRVSQKTQKIAGGAHWVRPDVYMTDTAVTLPFEDFGGEGQVLHFCHANGYPPRAYRALLSGLSAGYHVLAMHMRPLWPGSQPQAISDWRPLADDLARFLDRQGLSSVVGWGHSMGAVTTLRLALRQPERFQALVLIDPVLFPRYFTYLWEPIYRLGLAYRLHPLARGALKRRGSFDSQSTMYANYRRKPVFQHLSDAALQDYVQALGCPLPDGRVKLCYPGSWEARIYVTGVRADLELWRGLPHLKPPLLIIRGEQSDTFWEKTGRLVLRQLPSARVCTIPDAGHLVALERPVEVLAAAREHGFLPTFANHSTPRLTV